MERISFEEFITDVKEHQSALHDGHDLGLIIDESNGSTDRVSRAVQAMSKQAPTIFFPVDALLKPSKIKAAISAVNGGEAVVFLKADVPLTTSHYAHLQGLVTSHALEEWHNQGTEREMVKFADQSRFVLVVSRNVFQEALKTFPPIWEILGVSLSLDDARDVEGK
jgi:hypothetical protein